MQVAKIQISNILGIDSLEISPGKITEISGQNGVGKTSVLEAIKGVLGGGHNADLLRKGASEAEVVLVFDNGEKLIKKMTKFKSDIRFEDADGKKLKLGASYIKEIIDPVGLNPIRILTADPKDRLKMLLDSVPMEMPFEAIKFITGLDVEDDGRHPLKVVEEKHKDIFQERAFLNAEVKKQETMISEMRKTIPFKPDGTDWGGKVGELRGVQEEILEAQVAIKGSINSQFSTAIKNAEQTAQKEIDELKGNLAKQLGTLNQGHRKELDESEKKFAPRYEQISSQIQEADQNSKNQASIKGAQDFVDKHQKEKEINEQGANTLTEQIKSLDALKGEMLLSLPVEGLEVKDGDIYIKGVPFDTLNEAARIRFCLMIAGLRKTKLPLVCVDGLEALDEGVFNIFREEANKTDMQFFVTRVSEDESLTIN